MGTGWCAGDALQKGEPSTGLDSAAGLHAGVCALSTRVQEDRDGHRKFMCHFKQKRKEGVGKRCYRALKNTNNNPAWRNDIPEGWWDKR